ncbi:MAG: N-acetyltransferase family protein [Bacillota bacterium]
MTAINVRQGKLADLSVIKAIGRQTFKETFGDDNTAEDMENYLQATFNDYVLHQSLKDPDVHYFLACINEEVIGYIKLNEGDSQTEVGHNDSLEIHRLYVLPSYLGHGIGKQLMTQAIEFAISQLLNSLWLGVWEHNERAIGFYRSFGFQIFDHHVFTLGEDKQTDYLMRLTL